ncbi:hypothetical protein KPL74_03815 [Bacillus sp. NP157]|nr:hypothetical protein KPL74_03815 [Bacillus sp. NP157]
MMDRFSSMPRILRLLTLGGLAGCLIPLSQMLSGGVDVFGQTIRPGILWQSGLAAILIPSAIALGVSSVQFLLRSRNGRSVHVAGWVLMATAVYVGPRLLHIDVPLSVPTSLFVALLTAAIAGYLYLSKDVVSYFSASVEPERASP